MNNKGFTLVEMLVSFAIVSVISLIMMNVLFTVKERSEKSSALTELTVMQSNISKTIKNDLDDYTLISVVNCGTRCYDFTYSTIGTKRLSVNTTTNVIMYGSYSKTLPTGSNANSLVITSVTTAGMPVGNNSIMKIVIGISNTYNDMLYNVELFYQYRNTNITVTL